MPDPTQPTIENGGFESVAGDPPAPTGWYYQRQLELIHDKDAPEGKNYVTFKNTTPGRGSQALQGFAVDGRKVVQLRISCEFAAATFARARTPSNRPPSSSISTTNTAR